MPKVRKLSEDEVRTIEYKNKGQRKVVEEQYDEFLQDYDLGDYGEAELEEDEKRITVRNRLKAAAQRRGIGLEFRRTKGDTLRFRVVTTDEGEQMSQNGDMGEDAEVDDMSDEQTVSTEAPPAPRKRGRRKKNEE